MAFVLIPAQNRRRLGNHPGAVHPRRARARNCPLTRCQRTICRKFALGLETGDASLVREQVFPVLSSPGAGHTDGLQRLREQLDTSGMPDAERRGAGRSWRRCPGCRPPIRSMREDVSIWGVLPRRPVVDGDGLASSAAFQNRGRDDRGRSGGGPSAAIARNARI